ncbi:GDSL esterase/lipase [Camellia lanceoleosa]|uniref:GDSL esterase/lipase n=1 Tax=Camellia lanceoleosa TaxID=1840588 RepID=A0ACC0I0F0_9ERIC|nr:GDSL esterase/lipase [Camellia lanceoleosa]
MESRSSIWALGWLLFFTLVVGENGVVANSSNSKSDRSRDCKFPAIFNFGDSHSDTGTTSAAFDSLGAPRGMSFPGLPGRACDGRLIIDFIGNNPPIQNNLPEPKVFSEALYTIDIGSNDQLDNLSISKNMNRFSNFVQRLLRGGAKYLWIHNIGPASCTPSGHNICKNKPGCVLDQNGCDIKSSKSIQEFNKQLKDTVYKLRAQYPDAVITYVDIYSAKHRLIVNAKNYGFTDPFKFCCGNEFRTCGAVDFNGELLVNACNDPQKYISWDGLHYSQAANQIVAKFVVNGSFSDPPVPVAKACHKQY